MPARSAASQSGSGTVSLLRNARNSPRASRAPALLPPAKPRFSSRRTIRTSRKRGAHEVDRAVGRAVVDEDDLRPDALLRCGGTQAGLEILAAVPGDDDDRESGYRCVTERGRRRSSRDGSPIDVQRQTGRPLPGELAGAGEARPRAAALASRSSFSELDDRLGPRRLRPADRAARRRRRATSGIDATFDAMTGVPHAIASTSGRPKPS